MTTGPTTLIAGLALCLALAAAGCSDANGPSENWKQMSFFVTSATSTTS